MTGSVEVAFVSVGQLNVWGGGSCKYLCCIRVFRLPYPWVGFSDFS